MNQEGLKEYIDKLKVKQERQARQDQKQLERDKRKSQRLAPFIELANKNRSIGERAQTLINLGRDGHTDRREQDHDQHIWIILGKPEAEEDYWMLGCVKKEVEIWKNRHNFSYSFDVYTAQDKEDVLYAKQHPHAASTRRRSPLREEVYLIDPLWRNDDYIMLETSTKLPDRKITPVSAIRRYKFHRDVSNHLANLEDTVTLFEQAAGDTELNPHLQGYVEASGLLPQVETAS